MRKLKPLLLQYCLHGKEEHDFLEPDFSGIAKEMSNYNLDNGDTYLIGVYGSYYVLEHIDNTVDDVTYFWQCKAWSDKKDFKTRDLYPYSIDKSLKLNNRNAIIVDF